MEQLLTYYEIFNIVLLNWMSIICRLLYIDISAIVNCVPSFFKLAVVAEFQIAVFTTAAEQ